MSVVEVWKALQPLLSHGHSANGPQWRIVGIGENAPPYCYASLTVKVSSTVLNRISASSPTAIHRHFAARLNVKNQHIRPFGLSCNACHRSIPILRRWKRPCFAQSANLIATIAPYLNPNSLRPSFSAAKIAGLVFTQSSLSSAPPCPPSGVSACEPAQQRESTD